MFWRRKVAPQEIAELRVAAVQLFGLKQATTQDFWKTLSMEKVKKAFREKARLFHPDLYRQARPEALKAKAEGFIKVKNSYEVLRRFLGAEVFKNFG
jgi:flagellar biosynthesis protein FlhG